VGLKYGVILPYLLFFKLFLCILLAVAFYTIWERKVLGALQRRRGPMAVGVHGLLQAISDGLKLFTKEFVMPVYSDKWLYIYAPIVCLIFSMMGWHFIPMGYGLNIGDFHLGVFILFIISALGVYGLIMAG